MKTLELNQMEVLQGGKACQEQLAYGVGLMLGGLLLGTVTFGLGAVVAIAGYGIGWNGARGHCS
jgi:hypothetical protein